MEWTNPLMESPAAGLMHRYKSIPIYTPTPPPPPAPALTTGAAAVTSRQVKWSVWLWSGLPNLPLFYLQELFYLHFSPLIHSLEVGRINEREEKKENWQGAWIIQHHTVEENKHSGGAVHCMQQHPYQTHVDPGSNPARVVSRPYPISLSLLLSYNTSTIKIITKAQKAHKNTFWKNHWVRKGE